MKKRIIAGIALAAILLGLLSMLAGCGEKKSDIVTADEAKAIALEQAGLTEEQAGDVHTHIVTENGIPCFSVHISSAEGDYSYVISATDGTILSGGEGSGH